ncbi:MAG: hypothetical protein LBL36_00180 [Clostridiales Family XIII bacterium]|nr:hypothetical protein [Clostridiales Family XIII bacterium]
MKKHNKYVSIVIIAISLFLTTSFSFADSSSSKNVDMFPSGFDKEYVINDMVNWLNDTYRGDEGITTTKKDIDLSKAYKIYVDTDIFTLKSNKYDDIVAALEKGTYFYFVPIFDKDATYLVNVQYYKPLSADAKKILTEEEIADYNSKVGKWAVVGIDQYDDESPFRDYYTTAAKATGNNKEKPLLIGSLPYFRDVVALYSDGNGNAGSIVPIIPELMETELLGLNVAEKSKAYQYGDIKEKVAYAKKIDPDRNENLIGGSSGINETPNRELDNASGLPLVKTIGFVIVGIALISVAVVLILIRRGRKMQMGKE